MLRRREPCASSDPFALFARGLSASNHVEARVREEVGSLRREMTDGFTRLRTEIVELRGDVDVGFTAQRMQNDRRFLDHERRLRELEAQR